VEPKIAVWKLERQAAKTYVAQIKSCDSPVPKQEIRKDDKTAIDQERRRGSVEARIAAWKQFEIKWKLERQAARTHVAQIKSCDSPEPEQKSLDPDVPIQSGETKRARWLANKKLGRKERQASGLNRQ
jgi:hypothetical protein